jgi:hypothetical protein
LATARPQPLPGKLADEAAGDGRGEQRLACRSGQLPGRLDTTTSLRALPFTPWQGPGVLALWAAGALLTGALILRFRDA